MLSKIVVIRAAASSASLLGVEKFALAFLERVGHGVERAGDAGDFRALILDLHTARIVAEPPPVGRVDELPERAMDEATGAGPCQKQHQRRTQDDQKNAALCAALDRIERMALSRP